MKITARVGLICILTGFGVPALQAKDFSTYRVGSVTDEDIITPVALEVVDPTATAVLKSAEAAKMPVIFRSHAETTNALANQFQAVFENARTNFISAIQDEFHQTTLDHAAVISPDFGYFVTAFNIRNKKFPVPTILAVDWAYGKIGEFEKSKLLNALLQTAPRFVRPDELPEGFAVGKIVQLVPVNNFDEKLTLADAETRGQNFPESNLTAVSQVRAAFRRELTGDDEQPLAWALSALIKPNCIPDLALTQLARDRATGQLAVAEHYSAGQIIARQGSVVDAKIKAALDELQKKSAPDSSDQKIAAVPQTRSNVQPMTLIIDAPAKKAAVKTESRLAIAPNQSAKEFLPKNWLVAGLIFFAAAILIVLWRFILHRRYVSVAVSVAKNPPPPVLVALQAELAPQLMRLVRETLVQELVGQRRDLLYAQQLAAVEVARLVRKMDELQMAMQERLQTYEAQIQKLETELAARTEENRELIKLKIEMIREQLEVESAGKRMEFN